MINPYDDPDTGKVALVRLDDWLRRPSEVDVMFRARWLLPRGYGSCWLRVPQMLGYGLSNLALSAADAVNGTTAPTSGASGWGPENSSLTELTGRPRRWRYA